MTSKLRTLATPPGVIALLALFLALGGSSYAAVQLSKGSVKNRHLATNAVTSAKVKNGSLKAVDFARGALPAAIQGERGLTGPAGPAGPAGPQGPRGGVDAKIIRDGWRSEGPNAPKHVLAVLPGGLELSTSCSSGRPGIGIRNIGDAKLDYFVNSTEEPDSPYLMSISPGVSNSGMFAADERYEFAVDGPQGWAEVTVWYAGTGPAGTCTVIAHGISS